MVKCNAACVGIECDQRKGVLPRCLYYEPGCTSTRGCAVIGINPGQAKRDQIEHYRTAGGTYEATVQYWEQRIKLRHPYYMRTRKLLRSLGLNGPVLWSELAKCQRESGKKGLPPLGTLRTCAGRFLREELALIPDWPLVALGREAFKALAYLYPTRTVIGVPHPTGAYGNKLAALCCASELRKNKRKVQSVLTAAPGRLLWLSDQE
jgi:hypothetical protein